MNRIANLYKALIATLILLILLILCIPLHIIFASAKLYEIGAQNDPVVVSSFNKTGTYIIDPGTIFTSIEKNQFPILNPANTVIPIPGQSTRLTWTQTEYQKIAKAFFEFVWKEALDVNWSVHRASFLTSCTDMPAGFERATFIYNQLIFQDGNLKYNARAIEIAPNNESVSWGGDTVLPRPIRGANAFDLDKISISADEALTMAEKEGGTEARQSMQNDCRIGLFLDEKWKVVYFSESQNASSDFELIIDPYTGKILPSQ